MAKDIIAFLKGKAKTFEKPSSYMPKDAVESFEAKIDEQIVLAQSIKGTKKDDPLVVLNGKKDWIKRGKAGGKPGYWVQFGRPAIDVTGDEDTHFHAETPDELIEILQKGKELLKNEDFKAKIKAAAQERAARLEKARADKANDKAIADTGADQGDAE